MDLLYRIVDWVVLHWKGISFLVASVGGAIMWFLKCRKAHIELEEDQEKQRVRKLSEKTHENAQTLQVYMHEVQRGKNRSMFLEDELRDVLDERGQGDRILFVLDHLQQQNKVKKSSPGWWEFTG